MRPWGIPMAVLAIVGVAVQSAGCWGSDYRKVDAAVDAGSSPGACAPFTLVPPTQCDGPDRLSDPDSCCVLGRSCLGAACDNGRCEAMELAYSLQEGEAIDVLVFGDEVLWSAGGSGVLYGNQADGPADPRPVAEDPNGYVTSLAMDDQYVYWVEYEGPQVWRKDPSTPQGTEQLVADTGSELGGFGRITVVGDTVFWVTAGLEETFEGNSVWMAAKDGSDSNSPTRIHAGGWPHGVASDGESVYWTDRSETAGGVFRLALSDVGSATSPEQLAPREGALTDIAIHDGRLVWLDDGTVYARDSGGGAISELGYSSFGWSLAFDEVFVYWTDEYEGTLYRAALDGGGAVTQAIAYGDNPKGLAVGCEAIYFANWADNDPDADWVSKVAK